MVAITSPTRNGSQDESNSLMTPEQESPQKCSYSRKSARKQWSVQGEPRSLLKRLRSQLAEDGCPESQFAMAKALLEHQEDLNYEENCHQAIFWLTQASLQGCLEATDLLSQCLEKGLGICEQNYQDVKRCLEMDHQEKLALVAGKQLFMSLAEGNEFVTEKKLETKVAEIIGCEEDEKDDEATNCGMKEYLEEKYGSRKLNESLIVEAALEFVRGEVPSLIIKKTNSLEPKECSYFSWNIDVHFFIINLVEKGFYSKLSQFCHSPYILSAFFFVFLTILFYFLSWGNISTVFVTCLWLISFFTMSLSAVAVLIRWKNKANFKLWALIFQQFNQDLNLDEASVKYNHKFISHYITYFGSMLIYLMFLPVITTGVKVFVTPPLLLISCSMVTCLLQSNFTYNCLSSILYIFAHSVEGQRYLKDWIIHSLPVLKPYIIEESFCIYNHLYINLDIGSIFHGLWFVSLVFVSLTIGLSGILLHGLCITWFHMTLVALCQHLSPWIYCSLIFWSLLLFLPQCFHFLTVFTPTFLLALCCFVGGVSPWLIILVFISISMLLGLVNCFDSKLASILKSVVFVLSFIFLFQQQVQSSSKVSALKWEQFQNICFPTKETMSVLSVRNCRPLKGTIVHWQATIKQIEIDSIFNLPEAVISILPAITHPQLKCSLGIPPPSCERDLFNSDSDHQQCMLLREAKGTECSLENWNEYRFHFIVSMGTNFWKFSENSELVLVGGNEFREAAFNLTVHDKVSFIGILDEGLGTVHPKITLTSINCLDCRVKNIAVSNSFRISFDFEVLQKSLKSTFNFLFGPTLTV